MGVKSCGCRVRRYMPGDPIEAYIIYEVRHMASVFQSYPSFPTAV
jgi:hypothetical protein